MSADACYAIFNYEEEVEPTVNELRTQLEKGDDHTKIMAMKSILGQNLSGETLSMLLMHVLRFVMPNKNKILKKLLLLYYEIVPKKNPDGKLKQEFILIWCALFSFSFASKLTSDTRLTSSDSNALRNDLQHPNEYVRGSTLRFLCKLHETEVLEPCIPSIRQNLVRPALSDPSPVVNRPLYYRSTGIRT